jgi:hypothetical protein
MVKLPNLGFARNLKNGLQIEWDIKKLAITTKNAYIDSMLL